MVHLMTVRGTTVGDASFETDRMEFIGRGRSLASPAAMDGSTPLSGSQGPVLDPVVCIRRVIQLEPNETARVDLVTGVGETREAVAAIMNKYHDPNLADRVFELAWTHSHVLLRQLNASEADAQIYGRLAGSVIYASSLRRANSSVLARNRRSQSGLWGYGISGDLPIVLVRIRDRTRIELVRQAVQAHAYWRMKGHQSWTWSSGTRTTRFTGSRCKTQSWTSSPLARKQHWSTNRAACSSAAASKWQKRIERCCKPLLGSYL